MKNQFLYLTLFLCVSCSTITSNPDKIELTSTTFTLEKKPVGNLLISKNDTLNLGIGDVFIYDFNKDGQMDFCLYRKNNDFRDHFGYLDIYLNIDSIRHLNDLIPAKAKFKENHWAWLNVEQYPGLNDPKFLDLIKSIEKNY